MGFVTQIERTYSTWTHCVFISTWHSYKRQKESAGFVIVELRFTLGVMARPLAFSKT